VTYSKNRSVPSGEDSSISFILSSSTVAKVERLSKKYLLGTPKISKKYSNKFLMEQGLGKPSTPLYTMEIVGITDESGNA
jgi:hypothetical protein